MSDTQDKDKLLSHIKELEDKIKILEKDLVHDTLTGMKTRNFFEEEARVYLDSVVNAERGERRHLFGFKNISFIFFDVDFFKKVNDTYGHLVGDKVLITIAKTIRESLRDGDTAARWGGEEIVVTLVGATENDAKEKAEEIRENIEALKFPDNPDLHLTISSGVASGEAGLTLEDIMKHADLALYKAKESGRNCVVAYSELKK
jgi:diguanylate cyclase (GGDEF)-like protein